MPNVSKNYVTLWIVVLLMLMSYSAAHSQRGDVEKGGVYYPPIGRANYLVTPDSITEDFRNELAAKKKYSNKIIWIKGNVEEVSSFWNEVFIDLKGAGLLADHVQCKLAKDHHQKAGSVQPGSEVTLECNNAFKSVGKVMLQNCRLIGY